MTHFTTVHVGICSHISSDEPVQQFNVWGLDWLLLTGIAHLEGKRFTEYTFYIYMYIGKVHMSVGL